MTARALAAAAAAAVAACAASGSAPAAPATTLHFVSRPDLTPPAVTILRNAAGTAPGDLFLAPKKGAIEKGPEIVTSSGRLVWFHPVPAQATDFRVQTFRGRPVLTWWQGPVAAPVRGSGVGHGVIMDATYRQIARVDSTYGANTADLHEFQLTPQGTALLTVYRIVPFDLSSVGGPHNGKAVDGIVQEVDVATGRVRFTWHSLAHIGLDESYAKVPSKAGDAYDYAHLNSIDVEPNGNLLVSARNTHAVYEISRHTSAIVWRLGGKRSSFRMGPGTSFAWQHDARRQADGTITIFDDGAAPAVEKHSRAIRIRLHPATRTATLVHADVSPARLLAVSQGNAQVLPNGDTLVGWGSVPRVTEFDDDGQVVFDATLPKTNDSYRAYRFPWTATPAARPAIAVRSAGVGTATVFASWNGATTVARWRVFAGLNAENLHSAGADRPVHGFETAMTVHAPGPFFAVEAIDAHGRVLERSAAVERGGVAVG